MHTSSGSICKFLETNRAWICSSSPSPRPHAPVRPVDLLNFPTDVLPNLRIQLPVRSASAGWIRPGMALSSRLNSNNDAAVHNSAPVALNKRNYVPPVASRGMFLENSLKGSSTKSNGSNGHELASDNGLRRSAKPISSTESTGFGRNILKKSIDMTLRHMISALEDTRNRTLHRILRVQSCFRGHQAQRYVKEMMQGIFFLQSFIRAEKAQKVYSIMIQRHRAALVLQRSIKSEIAGKNYKNTQSAALLVQSVIRGWLVRRCSRDIALLDSCRTLSDKEETESEEVIIKASVLAELHRKILKVEAELSKKR